AEVAEVLGRLLAQAQQPGGLPRTAPARRRLRIPQPCLTVLFALAVGLLVGGCVWLMLTVAFALRDRAVRDLQAEAAAEKAGRPALSGCEDHTVRLWEVATGRELKCFRGHTAGVRAVAFSPDGRRALSGGKDGTVRLWDVETGKQLRQFDGHEDLVESVAFV